MSKRRRLLPRVLFDLPSPFTFVRSSHLPAVSANTHTSSSVSVRSSSGGHSRLRIIAGARAGQFFQQDFSQNQQNFDLPGCSIDQQIDSQKDSSVNQQNFGLPGCWIDQQIDLQKYADFSGIIAAGQQISQFVCRSENNIVLLDLAAVAVGTRSSTCFQQMGASTLAAQNPRRTTYMARPINRE